ncbi:MAG: insulinase family protein [Acidobacteria bacterium]|nr:insulinase family protein [Acidobacteriota bacterium]
MTIGNLFLIFACAALAQEPEGAAQSFRGMVRLNRAPVSNEILKIRLPRPTETKLSNGLRLLVVESHRAPTISLTITLPSSSLRDPAGLPGLASATAAMIQLGTSKRSAKQLRDDLSDIGATLIVTAGGGGGGRGRGGFGPTSPDGSAVIALSSMTENFDAALELLTDVLLHPAFPEDEFRKWKTRELGQLEQLKTSPTSLGSEMMYKTLYPGDARSSTRVTEESIQKMTRDDLIAHYKSYYLPAGRLAGIAGDINAKQAVAKLEKALSGWKGGPVERLTLPLNPPIAEKKVILQSRPNSVQTYLIAANRSLERTNPDYIASMVVNQVLGSGPASRLFRILREEKGYTYGVYSAFTASRYSHHFTAAMQVRTEVTEAALADLLRELRDIAERPVPKDELDGAKRAIVASFAMSLENPSGVLSQWMIQREYGLPEDYFDTFPEKVMKVDAAELQRVAKKYVPYANTQIIAVGDGDKIREVLKKFGPVAE